MPTGCTRENLRLLGFLGLPLFCKPWSAPVQSTFGKNALLGCVLMVPVSLYQIQDNSTTVWTQFNVQQQNKPVDVFWHMNLWPAILNKMDLLYAEDHSNRCLSSASLYSAVSNWCNKCANKHELVLHKSANRLTIIYTDAEVQRMHTVSSERIHTSTQCISRVNCTC